VKRNEILHLRRQALLSLKALFVGSLDAEFVKMIHPAQVAAATALHQACCRELEYSFNGIDLDLLVDQLSGVNTELREALDPDSGDDAGRKVSSAQWTVSILIDSLGDSDDYEDDDDEGGV
jgi:hypothetical protein